MRKIFYILFLLFISYSSSFAINDIKIISREEWGANEYYRFIDSTQWQEIFKKREEEALKIKNTVYTQEQIDTYKTKQEKLKTMDEILINDFGDEIELSSTIKYENGKKLAWPISKTKKIKAIVIHHTYSDYESSLVGVRNIYKYHALTRQWGDIGYNYLIGKDGEIYEGRAGGDYVVAAHDKWNNRATVGIALIGNYEENPINIKQYNALKALTRVLIKKYDIDLTEKTYFHEECFGEECSKPLKSTLKSSIVGHRDAGHTLCPGDALYAQIDEIKLDLLKDPISVANIYKKKVFKSLSKFSDENLIDVLAKVEGELEIKRSSNKLKLKGLIIDYFEYKKLEEFKNNLVAEKTDKKQNIKIKLSYPDSDNISIISGGVILDLVRRGNSIFVKGQKYNILKIPKKDPKSILEISSWNRIPSWDKTGKYNDNKFRGDLYIYVKNNKLVVVNSLEIDDYLKGLGEVSDFEDTEKIKTIITAARSYATWYTTKARKFPGEFYDGSDDPNVFQKYLGYGLEQRSPNLNKVVDETKGQLIRYNGELIKPWYFSSSNGQTMSFYEYCIIRYSNEICSVEAKKYPYLQSVVDKGSDGMVKRGHGVGISGKGVSYFAEKGWSYDMIIKYFLKGVNIL